MSELQSVDVLISGAGPVGLFLANQCQRLGLTSRLIDKRNHLSRHSKALGLHARSLEIFMDTGCIDAMLHDGLLVERFCLMSGTAAIARVALNKIDAPYSGVLMLPQNQTEEILYQELKKNGGEIDWQHELTDFTQDKNLVTAAVKTPSGEMQTQVAKWIVGCDGAHSTTRHIMGVNFEGAPYKEHWWLVDCRVDWDLPNNEVFNFLSSTPVIFFPIKDNRYRIVLRANPNVVGDPNLAQVSERMASLVAVPHKLSDAIWTSAFTIHHRHVDSYRNGRAFLAGDAAHIHSPAGGQGLNTGVQDAYNLAWKLALVTKHNAPDKLLDSYNAERHAVGVEVVKMTDRMTKVIGLKNPLLRAIRNKIIGVLLSSDKVQNKFANQMSQTLIHYGDSPLNQQEGDFFHIKAGDLVPNMPLFSEHGEERNIFSILDGRKFSLLYFGGNGDEAQNAEILNQFLQETEHLINCHCIFTQKPEALHWPGKKWIDKQATKTGLLMIRPDQYVGFVSDKLDFVKLTVWFKQFTC